MNIGIDKMVATNEKKYVKFHKNCSPYLAGEVGLFGVVPAAKLTAGPNPIGFYVIKNDKGLWVPEIGEENGNLEQTDLDKSDEQTGIGEGTGTGETETEQEGDNLTVDPGNSGDAVKPKAGRQSKRKRAKL